MSLVHLWLLLLLVPDSCRQALDRICWLGFSAARVDSARLVDARLWCAEQVHEYVPENLDSLSGFEPPPSPPSRSVLPVHAGS